MSEDLYKSELGKRLGVDASTVQLYWKGRVGLYALLKAMGVGPGDAVLMPAFTCVVVPNAVIYTGARPRYVDIDRSTLNPLPGAIRAALTENTKCILLQNTLGLSSDLDEIVSLARERGILTIEDCTHGFGGLYQGRPNGTFCDAAFFSTQWNKPFSTGLGGFVAVNQPELLARLEVVNQGLERPSLLRQASLRLLIEARRWLVRDRSYWPLMGAYRALSKRGLILGSSSGAEIESTKRPRGYFQSSCRVQSDHGLKALGSLDALLELRRANGRIYNQFMKERGKFHYGEEHLVDHAFLRYPALARNREVFSEDPRRHRIRLGDWFNSMLHPVQGDLDPWHLNQSSFPVAREIARKIVNLPTDIPEPAKVLQFLESRLDRLE